MFAACSTAEERVYNVSGFKSSENSFRFAVLMELRNRFMRSQLAGLFNWNSQQTGRICVKMCYVD